MVEGLKSKVEKEFGEVKWEEALREENLSVNLPDLVVCMGMKGGKELILGFSRDLILRFLSEKLKCDSALIDEKEIISEVRSLVLDITRDLRDLVIPSPVVVKGNFMELTVHKAKITAYWGTVLGGGGVFLGVVEPQESFP